MNDQRGGPEGPDDSEDDKPPKRFLETIPRGTITRVVVLLAALAGIIILQQKTGSIASCMNQAFLAPQSRPDRQPDKDESRRIRGQVVVPGDGGTKP